VIVIKLIKKKSRVIQNEKICNLKKKKRNIITKHVNYILLK
jgi:hypothetical protein